MKNPVPHGAVRGFVAWIMMVRPCTVCMVGSVGF